MHLDDVRLYKSEIGTFLIMLDQRKGMCVHEIN